MGGCCDSATHGLHQAGKPAVAFLLYDRRRDGSGRRWEEKRGTHPKCIYTPTRRRGGRRPQHDRALRQRREDEQSTPERPAVERARGSRRREGNEASDSRGAGRRAAQRRPGGEVGRARQLAEVRRAAAALPREDEANVLPKAAERAVSGERGEGNQPSSGVGHAGRCRTSQKPLLPRDADAVGVHDDAAPGGGAAAGGRQPHLPQHNVSIREPLLGEARAAPGPDRGRRRAVDGQMAGGQLHARPGATVAGGRAGARAGHGESCSRRACWMGPPVSAAARIHHAFDAGGLGAQSVVNFQGGSSILPSRSPPPPASAASAMAPKKRPRRSARHSQGRAVAATRQRQASAAAATDWPGAAGAAAEPPWQLLELQRMAPAGAAAASPAAAGGGGAAAAAAVPVVVAAWGVVLAPAAAAAPPAVAATPPPATPPAAAARRSPRVALAAAAHLDWQVAHNAADAADIDDECADADAAAVVRAAAAVPPAAAPAAAAAAAAAAPATAAAAVGAHCVDCGVRGCSGGAACPAVVYEYPVLAAWSDLGPGYRGHSDSDDSYHSSEHSCNSFI